jgi:iron complex transport system ATP-binding protein
MASHALEVRGLVCGYRGRAITSAASFVVAPGEWLFLLGPNGAGKTTLFKTILRLLPALGGCVRLGGEDVAEWTARRFAAHVGYVPQAHMPPFAVRVQDVVAMGRAAHLGPFATPGARDRAIAEQALGDLGILALRDAAFTALSGGERQLVLIARALAQQPAVLVMDEPTANLDFGNQARVLSLVRALVARRKLGVLMTSHDPNQALQHADRVAALGRDGRLHVGPPADVVTESYMKATYGVDVRVAAMAHPDGGSTRFCVPMARP